MTRSSLIPLPEEEQIAGAHTVAVISYPFWQRRFKGDPATIEHVLKLNGATKLLWISLQQTSFGPFAGSAFFKVSTQ